MAAMSRKLFTLKFCKAVLDSDSKAVEIDSTVNTVSSDFFTITWTVYIAVDLVVVQHRATSSPSSRIRRAVDWIDGDPIPADRGVYYLEDLTPGVTYDYRLKLVNGTEEKFGETNQVTLCPEGYQGANCEIDYSTRGAFNVRLIEATSSSLNITWQVSVDILWARVQYKQSTTNTDIWISLDQLPATQLQLVIPSLAENIAYDVRVVVMRTDATATTSDMLQMKTCKNRFAGLNCENEIPIITTPSVPTTAQKTTASSPLYSIQTVDKTSASLTFNWTLLHTDAVSQVIVEYQVNGSGGLWTTLPAVSPQLASFVIGELSASTSHDIRLKLEYRDGSEAYGDVFTLTTCQNGFQGDACQTVVATIIPTLAPFEVGLSHINSLSITTKWSAPASVTAVVQQYRLTNDDPWMNGSVVSSHRGQYVLRQLEANTGYEVRLIFQSDNSITYSNVLDVDTCARGFAGQGVCDTDYTEIGAYDVVLETATSASLAITWDVNVAADWHVVQYRDLATSQWFNSSQLDAGIHSYTADDLEAGQSYYLRVLTRRTVTRRKRADLVENVGISAQVLYVTCSDGMQGLNCEQEVVPTTTPVIDATTQPLPSSDVPWKEILIGLSVALFVFVIILISLVLCIHRNVKRQRARTAKIEQTGPRQRYHPPDIMYASDSRSSSSVAAGGVHDDIDYAEESTDPEHVRISMVGSVNNNTRDEQTNTVWDDEDNHYDNSVFRYNAAYNYNGEAQSSQM